jgi:hypothetical protein
MQEANQGPADEAVPAPPPPDGLLAPPGGEDASLLAAGAASPEAALPPIMPGLWTWFTIIGVLGLVGVLWGQAELALSVALAGAFVGAHAADRDPGLASLHQLLSGLLVAGGATIFALLAFWLATQSAAGPARPLAVGIAGGGAVLCLLTALRPFADGLAAAFFRTAEPNHTLRLGARLVMMVLLFAFPGWAGFPGLLDAVADSGKPLLDTAQLLSSVVGLSVLALGAVGFLIRRDARATFDRLGLRALRPAHYGIVALGIAALYLLNTGTEGLQQRWFPGLWDHDQRMSRLIARGLGVGGGLLLGLSAGVGEELAMRGALQPRLGVVLTALVFAALHVHYSWYGVASIFLLGTLLGVIRDRTSTTVAILVHSLYDVAAVFTAGGAGR